jgi:maleate isomerase
LTSEQAAGAMSDDTDVSLRINRTQIPHELDRGVGWRARIGLVVLSSDYTIEHEFARMLSLPGVVVYHNRIENDAQVSAASLADMRARVASSVRLIIPEGDLDVVVFGCTSGSLVIGAQAVRDLIHGVREGVPCTTPIEAVAAALAALRVNKIALVTPYVDAINRQMRAHLLEIGVQVPVMGSWNIADDNKVAMLSAQSIARVVSELGAESDVDAVFVSCTNVPLVGQIRELEQAIGKPVISSNSATAWHGLRLAGIDDRLVEFGRLFETTL